jgi:DNA-binding response OmpR family regulator
MTETIPLLHVEDDSMQRRVLAHHLARIPDYQFAIRCVAAEDEAVDAFREKGAGCVIVDYELAQGNGLNCLRRIRKLDGVVPIIAVSGVATPEIAAELVHAGADDYVHKDALNANVLEQVLGQALRRAAGCRRLQSTVTKEAKAEGELDALCRQFLPFAGADFQSLLREFEKAARDASLNEEQVRRMFDGVCGKLATGNGQDASLILRPVLLEILCRLS